MKEKKMFYKCHEITENDYFLIIIKINNSIKLKINLNNIKIKKLLYIDYKTYKSFNFNL